MQQLLRQAQKMQADMERVQQELAETELEVSSGGGMVVCKVSGKGELKSIKINPEIVDPDDVEMLEDMVLAALQDALKQAEELSNELLGPLAGAGGMF